MQQYADAKMKWELRQEKARNAGAGQKGVWIGAATVSLVYSAILTFLFFKEERKAAGLRAENEVDFQCVQEMGINMQGAYKEDFAPEILDWMRLAWICYGILSVFALIAMVSAFLPQIKPLGCFTCCAQIFALVVTIGLSATRWSEGGEYCTEQAGKGLGLLVSPAVGPTMIFLSKAITAMWIGGCFHFCFLCASFAA